MTKELGYAEYLKQARAIIAACKSISALATEVGCSRRTLRRIESEPGYEVSAVILFSIIEYGSVAIQEGV